MPNPNKAFIDGLRRARKFIKKGWTQRTLARDKKGVPVPYDHPRACSWCLSGALHAARIGPWEVVSPNGRLRPSGVAGWNDDVCKNQQQALACIDNSIKALR